MSLKFYRELPWSSATELHPVDLYNGDGVTTTFTLAFKTGTELGSTIQADAIQYYQYTGGFVKAGNDFTLSSAPPNGSQIIAPGINSLLFSAFDQDNVSGVTDPRVVEVPFWIADTTEINVNSYTNIPSLAGIEISFIDMATGAGASTTWFQLANSDTATGLALTYQATGTALYTGNLQTFGTTASSSNAGNNFLYTNQASSFTVGDYVCVAFGTVSSEVRQISSITLGSIPRLNFNTNLTYAHAPLENIFTQGRKFWAKMTVPLNATGGEAANDYSIGIRKRGRIVSKI